jgi:hypothetical protein
MGLSKVLCPNDDDDTITDEITDPEELFDWLIKRNKKHFSQANETYLAKPPHSEILPPFHYSPAIHEVLEGNLNSFDSLQLELKALLTEMKALALPNTIDPTMTTANFRDGMKKVPEGKSSSLSGRNYSIYKAMLPDNYFTGKVVELINKGVTYGFILKRWRKVLQVMLCKKPGNYNIDKLRVIQLIEADLNMYYRLVWGKRLVHHARKLGFIPPEQFGSVPGRQAASALLLKVLSFDLIRLLRTTATVFNNDATACYDRILSVLSMICCQHLGLAPIATKFKLAFLRTAQYYIKTQYGTSDEWFGNAISEVFGVFQGSGAAPVVWLAASIVLIRAYNKLFPTNGIPNPTSQPFLPKSLTLSWTTLTSGTYYMASPPPPLKLWHACKPELRHGND